MSFESIFDNSTIKGTNLDLWIKQGTYFFTEETMKLCYNTPVEAAGTLVVLSANNGTHVNQIYIVFNSFDIYFRNKSAGEWSNWTDNVTDSEYSEVVSNISTVSSSVSTLEEQVNTNTSNISTLQDTVSTNTSDISEAQQNITSLQESIASVKESVEDITVVSTDSNNIITTGSDNGAYLSADTIASSVTDISGNAGTATKLATARTITLSGDTTGSTTFDGSSDVAITTTLASSGATAGSYGTVNATTLGHNDSFTVPYVTVDEKGRVTSISNTELTLPSDSDTTYSAGDGISITTTEGESTISVDSSVVRLDNSQTITGYKTFTSDILMYPSNLESNIQFKSAFDKGVAATSSAGSIWSAEAFGNLSANSPGNNRIARIGMEHGNNDVACYLQVNQPVASSATTSSIAIRWPFGDDTQPYATAPSTRSTPSSTEIITYDFLQNYVSTQTADDTVVKTTGAQTIAGSKTFTSDIHVKTNTNSDLLLDVTDFTKGDTPTSVIMGRVILSDSNGVGTDDTNRLAIVGTQIGTTGASVAYARAYKNEAGSTEYAQLQVVYPIDGDPYAVAPTTRSTPSSSEIVTVSYLATQLSNITSNNTYNVPLYFNSTDTATFDSIHTILPEDVAQVELVKIEADNSGSSALSITMSGDISLSDQSITLGSEAVDCSAFAGYAVAFTISGASDQTKVAALLKFTMKSTNSLVYTVADTE